ncbi:LPS export ABC transporter periplasmic protein LptC [Pelagibacterales bacterium SAG-MED02]|nr:LPS export ABC transporter periplasmic protein LptC [Pelagibacterales bacterium SAG-MED02]
MIKKHIGKIIFIILCFIVVLIVISSKIFEKKDTTLIKPQELENEVYSSNKIKDVKYTTKDADGNEYIITATEGEIDYSNTNIIYLTNLKAKIKLIDSDDISITSDYGKYNSGNFDTIFSKNVIINYLNNKITGEYLDFSLERNSLLMTKKVVYTNLDNILKADAVEMNPKTKDTKIFMYENQKKVNIKSIN